MSIRKHFLVFGQLVLVLAFLCAPIADNAHAMKMLQTKMGDAQAASNQMQEKMVMEAGMPCHEPMMMSADTSAPDKIQNHHTNDKKPCCPYKQCSPNDCLMHLVAASLSHLEILPHSPIDSRTFMHSDIRLATMPFSERLRPPIA